MGLNCGIVGLPNVGKSTIFNALTAAKAEASNYPFCTIDPNVGMVKVPDTRLQALAEIVHPDKIIPAVVEIVDIAGLVEGASKGEGLGNKFLGNIRSVDAIMHVVRCFEDENVVHVYGSVDPVRDIEVINAELILADLDSVEKRIDKTSRMAKLGDKKAKEAMTAYEKVIDALKRGVRVAAAGLSDDEKAALSDLFLLTGKPVLYVANVAEDELSSGNKYVDAVRKIAESEGSELIMISGKIESEIAELDGEEKAAFLSDLGASESGIDRIIRAAYHLLGLITYFTAGQQEVRAWTIHQGDKAPQAAGVIHTDFEKGFIRAETIAFIDYVSAGSETRAKELGLMRVEGKEYVVKDGDVMHFRFNV